MKKHILLTLVCLTSMILPMAVSGVSKSRSVETRYVKSRSISVYESPDKNSRIIADLSYLDSISVSWDQRKLSDSGIWLKVVAPVQGYVFQKKLIGSESNLVSETPGGMGDGANQEEKALIPDMDSLKYWLGVGVGVFVLPGDSVFNAPILATQELMLEFEQDGTWQKKLRFGASLARFKGSRTMNLFGVNGVYRYDFAADAISGFDFFALGGVFLTLVNFSGDVEGNTSGFGTIAGIGGYYDLRPYGFSELMKTGFQLTTHNGSAYIGGANQNLGYLKLQMFAIWHF